MSQEQEKKENKLPPLPRGYLTLEDIFYEGGVYTQSCQGQIKIDRPADAVFRWTTDNGCKNTGKWILDEFTRIKGGPQPEMQMGDIVRETTVRETPGGGVISMDFNVETTGLIPGRLYHWEGRVVHKGLVNPKVRFHGYYLYLPEPDGGMIFFRHFTINFSERPRYLVSFADPDVMQKALERLKKVVEAELTKN